jgi:hypothetical protein
VTQDGADWPSAAFAIRLATTRLAIQTWEDFCMACRSGKDNPLRVFQVHQSASAAQAAVLEELVRSDQCTLSRGGKF